MWVAFTLVSVHIRPPLLCISPMEEPGIHFSQWFLGNGPTKSKYPIATLVWSWTNHSMSPIEKIMMHVAYLNPGDGKIRDFKLHTNWSFSFRNCFFRSYTRKPKLSPQHVLLCNLIQGQKYLCEVFAIDNILNGKRKLPTLLPGKDLIFQTKASLSGAYAADPIDVRTLGFVASAGTGKWISTFVAVLYQVTGAYGKKFW